MSRPKSRVRVDHQHAAAQAREMPGRWVLAGTYPSTASAKSTAFQVRTGSRVPAYQPAGTYEARTEPADGGADLWIRHVPRQNAGVRESVEAGLTETPDSFSDRLDAAALTRRTP